MKAPFLLICAKIKFRESDLHFREILNFWNRNVPFIARFDEFLRWNVKLHSRCSLEKAWEFFFSLKYFVKLIYTTIMDTRIVWIMLSRSVQDECRREWVMHPKRFVPERRLRISAALSVFSGLVCKVIKMLLLSGRPWCMALTAFTLSLNKTIIHPRLSQIMHDLKNRFG